MQDGKTVRVIDKNGRVLMPTTPRKARVLIASGKAEKIGCRPTKIQLLHGSSGYVQPAVLGIDAGYSTIGYSVVNEREELAGGELGLLTGMSERLTERAMYRRQRRDRIRHRRCKGIDNHQPEGWLAPSIQHKLDSHQWLIDSLRASFPIQSVRIEVASFDTQKLQNPEVEGEQYQQGEQFGFANLRAYILHRDRHTCQNPGCKNKDKNPILQVHHVGYWKLDRSDRPGNLITLCTKCHASANHKPGKFLYGWEPKFKTMRAEAFMSMVWRRLAMTEDAEIAYGYETKESRKALGLDKSHVNDAFVIAGGSDQQRCEPVKMQQVRRHNRALDKFYDAKYVDSRDGSIKSGTDLSSGRRSRNRSIAGENLRVYRAHKITKGRRQIKRHQYSITPGDVVLYQGQKHTVVGMQNRGAYIKLENVQKVPSIKKVFLLYKTGGIRYVA